MTYTDGRSQPSHVKCHDFEGQRCLHVPKALSISIDVCAEERRNSPVLVNDDCATTCFRGGEVETEKHVFLVVCQTKRKHQILDCVPIQIQFGKDAARLD